VPINPNSRLRKTRIAIYGWKSGGKFYTSLKPRADNSPRNEHLSSTDALAEASKRHLPIVWENPVEITD
jgi:hypothetical protein